MGIKIYYKYTDGGAQLVRVFAQGDKVWIPGDISGIPIVSIAPYAFSIHGNAGETDILSYEDRRKGSVFDEELSMKYGDNFSEIHLPGQIREVGNYAFYGCRNLRLFHATDRLERMGSGVFTGCRLTNAEIDFFDGEQSCLKEILTEIRYELLAELHYAGGGTVKVLFPEHYADAVENTPARIVETHYYGSGGEYRECFYRRALDYDKYDSMFQLSRARDDSRATAELAAARLLYPYKLSGKAKEQYQNYVRQHMEILMCEWLEGLKQNREFPIANPEAMIDYCCREHLFTQESIERAIFLTAEYGRAELAGKLMQEQHNRFGRQKKTFEF